MKCPRCETNTSSDASECYRCGIIFEKYERAKKKKSKNEEESEKATAKAENGELGTGDPNIEDIMVQAQRLRDDTAGLSANIDVCGKCFQPLPQDMSLELLTSIDQCVFCGSREKSTVMSIFSNQIKKMGSEISDIEQSKIRAKQTATTFFLAGLLFFSLSFLGFCYRPYQFAVVVLISSLFLGGTVIHFFHAKDQVNNSSIILSKNPKIVQIKRYIRFLKSISFWNESPDSKEFKIMWDIYWKLLTKLPTVGLFDIVQHKEEFELRILMHPEKMTSLAGPGDSPRDDNGLFLHCVSTCMIKMAEILARARPETLFFCSE